MGNDFEVIIKAIKTGRLVDRLNTEAVHALARTTSVASMAAIMREAATYITELESQIEMTVSPSSTEDSNDEQPPKQYNCDICLDKSCSSCDDKIYQPRLASVRDFYYEFATRRDD